MSAVNTPMDILNEARPLIEMLETEIWEGRKLADDFLYLPPQETPDYYIVVTKPMALDVVKTKLQTGAYPTLRDVKSDLDQMWKNAFSYNQKTSRVYMDAQRMKRLANLRWDTMTGAGDAADEQRFREETSNPMTALKTYLSDRLSLLIKFADASGRQYSEFFMELPNRELFRDYYVLVQRPLAFNLIKTRVNKRGYNDVKGFIADVRTVFENAKFYNREDSQVYKDAVALEAYFADLIRYVPPEFESSVKVKLKFGPEGATASAVEAPKPMTLQLGGLLTPGVPGAPSSALVDDKGTTQAAIAAAAGPVVPPIDYATADPAEVIKHLQARGIHPAPSQKPPPPLPLPGRGAALVKTTLRKTTSVSHFLVSSSSPDGSQVFELHNTIARQHTFAVRSSTEAVEIIPSLAPTVDSVQPVGLRWACRPHYLAVEHTALTPHEATSRGVRAQSRLVVQLQSGMTAIDIFVRPTGQMAEELYRVFVQRPRRA